MKKQDFTTLAKIAMTIIAIFAIIFVIVWAAWQSI
jgi:hypothetical protein